MSNMKNEILLFLIMGVILSIFFSSGQIENPDTHLRLTQTRLFIDNGEFGLPKDVGEDLHGNIAVNRDGKRYMVYNPGQSVFFIPIYYFSELVSNNQPGKSYYLAAFIISFINYIIHALSALLVYMITKSIGASDRRAMFVALVFLLTSYSFSFAQSTYEHHFEMFFILTSYFLVLEKKVKQRYIFAGLLLSIGLFFRTTTVLVIPGILILIETNKNRLFFLLGVIPGSIFILIYNYYRFHNPLESGYSLAWLLAHGNNYSFWSIRRAPNNIVGLIFSYGKGLLIFSPTIIFSLLFARTFWETHKRIAISMLVTVVIYILLFSLNFAWHGSIWSFGPRYILPIVPLLYIPLTMMPVKKWMFLVLTIAFLSQVLIISVNYKRNVLEQFVKFKEVNEKEYIYAFDNNPYTSQYRQLRTILPKNLSGNFKNYQPDSPWKKEIRTGTNEQVLMNSIEKNSINFWWVRMFKWETSNSEKYFSVFILIIAIIGCIITARYVKRYF